MRRVFRGLRLAIVSMLSLTVWFLLTLLPVAAHDGVPLAPVDLLWAWQWDPLLLAGLAGIAALYASQGQLDEAVTLATLVQTHPACDDESRTKANEILQQVHAQNPTIQPAVLLNKSPDETLNHLVSALLTAGISPTLLSSFSMPLPPRFANVLTQVKGK